MSSSRCGCRSGVTPQIRKNLRTIAAMSHMKFTALMSGLGRYGISFRVVSVLYSVTLECYVVVSGEGRYPRTWLGRGKGFMKRIIVDQATLGTCDATSLQLPYMLCHAAALHPFISALNLRRAHDGADVPRTLSCSVIVFLQLCASPTEAFDSWWLSGFMWCRWVAITYSFRNSANRLFVTPHLDSTQTQHRPTYVLHICRDICLSCYREEVDDAWPRVVYPVATNNSSHSVAVIIGSDFRMRRFGSHCYAKSLTCSRSQSRSLA